MLHDRHKRSAVSYLMIGMALIISVVFSGGLNWQHCIIPLTMLIFCLPVIERHTGYNIYLLVLTALLVISTVITTGDTQEAIYESEKLLCFIASMLVCRSLKNDTYILKIISCIAAFTAFIGILSYCSVIDINEFTFNDNVVIRLQSFIRYANITACFLGCGYVSVLEIFAREKKRAYLYPGGLILIAMYLTFSKAFIPIFIVLGTVLIYFRKDYRTVFIVQNTASLITAVLMLFVIRRHLYFVAFALIAVCIAVGGAPWKERDKLFKIWLCVLGAAAAAAIAAVIIRPTLLYTLLLRMDYTQDAAKLLGNNLLFGNGIGSWRMAQYRVQSGEYNVTYMHNGIFQFVVENGLIFALMFMALVLFSVFKAIKHRLYHMAAMILLIIIHSAADFDLSMTSILIMLGMLSGVTLSITSVPEKRAKEHITTAVLIVCLLVTDIYMISEFFVRSSFERAYIAQDYSTARKRLDVLEKLCPRDSQLQVLFASVEEKTGNNTDEIRSRLHRAVQLSPNNPKLYESYMNYEIGFGDINGMCRQYIDMCPKQEYTYVFTKDYAVKAHEMGRITESELDSVTEMIESRRSEEGVIDRNSLLLELVNSRKE